MQPATTPIWAKLPNGETICTTHTCTLLLEHLPEKARHAHVLPNLALHSLISVVNLCNAGCKVLLTKIGRMIKFKGKTIICGHKCTNTGLWMIPLRDKVGLAPTMDKPTNPPIQPLIANITHMRDTSTPREYMLFLDQSLGSPPINTLLQALVHNAELQTIPGLTAELINKHLHNSPTNKGHLHRVRQHVASTHNNQKAIISARHLVDDYNQRVQHTISTVLLSLLATTRAQCTPI